MLRLVEGEIARQGGGVATIYTNQFELCGSRRVYRPALCGLQTLGLAEITRYPKRYVCKLADGWRGAHDALIASHEIGNVVYACLTVDQLRRLPLAERVSRNAVLFHPVAWCS